MSNVTRLFPDQVEDEDEASGALDDGAPLDDLLDDDLEPIIPDLPEEEEADPAPEEEEDAEPEIVDPRVELFDRVFDIDEPRLATYMMALNKAGELGLRSQRVVGRTLKDIFTSIVGGRKQNAVPIEATVFAFLTSLKPEDIRYFGALAMFGAERHKEGLAWLEQIEDQVKPSLYITAIFRAVMLRIRLSQDLFDDLKTLGLLPRGMRRGAREARETRRLN